ncbi:MAG: hypothetical protein DHS20C11_01420 [Lysobacteraceae bacterium]|nr:MAG: hypothetical protein DHS20C11_01420 [Xanthomonadaceae bacterium]
MTGSSQFALPIGTRFEQLEVVELLGSGGFGITYRCRDLHLQADVAVKEYFPNDIARRRADAVSVIPSGEDTVDAFETGKERFLNEARTLARFRHANLVRVHQFLEANGTAYLVMDYESGKTLLDRIRQGDYPDDLEIRHLLTGLLDGLEVLHEHGFLHHDIKPANVVLREDGSPVLIDFGAARRTVVEGTATMTRFLSPGYAPIEQYGADQAQGAWSDLYALGATFYHLITAHPPVESPQRALELATNDEETMTQAVDAAEGRYDKHLLAVIDWMLAVYPHERPENAAAVRVSLLGTGLGSEAPTVPIRSNPTTRAWRPWAISAALVAVAVLVFTWVSLDKRPAATVDSAYVSVGPFRAVGEDSEYLAEGVTEALVAQLGPTPGLFLVRSSPQLKTEWSIEGAVLRQGDKLRVTYQLSKLGQPAALRSGVVDGVLAELFDIQDRLSTQVGEGLAVDVGLASVVTLDRPEPVIGAYEAYLRGMVAVRKASTQSNLQEALEWFEVSLKSDEQFAPALAGICNAAWTLFRTTGERQLVDQAEATCRQALTIDPSLVATRVALGRLLTGTGRGEEAREIYDQAINQGLGNSNLYLGLAALEASVGQTEAAEQAHLDAIDRGRDDWRTHAAYGSFLIHRGRLDVAEQVLQDALSKTPFNADVLNDLGVTALYRGDFDSAVSYFEQAIEIDPTPEAFSNAGTTYFYAADYDRAADSYREALKLAPQNFILAGNLADALRLAGKDNNEEYLQGVELARSAMEVSETNMLAAAAAGLYLARAGRFSDAVEMISKVDMTRDQSIEVIRNMVVAYWLIGDEETAISTLEKAIELGYSKDMIESDPDMKDIRADQRAVEILSTQ